MYGLNFKRILLLAGMRLGIPEAMRFIQAQPEPILKPMLGMIPPPGRYRGAGAAGSKDRLLCDRSSSVKKMQRWLNNGDIPTPPPPNDAARRRHIHPRHKR